MTMVTDMTSDEIWLTLREMRTESGRRLYERVSLVKCLLADRAWVEDSQRGGGDEARALDRLEAECFGDLCGAISLPEMLDILYHMPDVRVWEKHKFQVKKLLAETQRLKKPKPSNKPPPTSTGSSTTGRPAVETPTGSSDRPYVRESETDRLRRTVQDLQTRLENAERVNLELYEENQRLKRELILWRGGRS